MGNEIKPYTKEMITAAAFFLAVSGFFYNTIDKDGKIHFRPHKTKTIKMPQHKAPKIPKEKCIEYNFLRGEFDRLSTFIEQAPEIPETVIINKDNLCNRDWTGLYSQGVDNVKIRYYLPDTTNATPYEAKKIIKMVNAWNKKHYRRAVKSHEYQHQQFYKKKIFDRLLSAEDYARICSHNEIAGNVNYLLYEREVFLKTKELGLTDTVSLQKLISPRYRAYYDAVMNGEVNPNSFDPIMQYKENKLILETVFNDWKEREWLINTYAAKNKLKSQIAKTPKILTRPRNYFIYRKALLDCYTFVKDGKVVHFDFFEDADKMKPSLDGELNPYGKIADIDVQPQVQTFLEQQRQKYDTKFRNDPVWQNLLRRRENSDK